MKGGAKGSAFVLYISLLLSFCLPKKKVTKKKGTSKSMAPPI
jgi:hypothetical protein